MYSIIYVALKTKKQWEQIVLVTYWIQVLLYI